MNRYILKEGTEFIPSRFKYEIQTGLTPPAEMLQQIEAAK